MAFAVLLTDHAVRDLENLYDYIAQHDDQANADYVATEIEKAVTSLSDTPEQGAYPKELLKLGIREFREIFFKPYRIIYRIIDEDIYILLIADGRREMQSLLERRLLEN